MKAALTVLIILTFAAACKKRSHVAPEIVDNANPAKSEVGSSDVKVDPIQVDVIKKVVEDRGPDIMLPAPVKEEPAPVVVPPSTVPLPLTAAQNYDQYCQYAKKIEITDKTVKVSTEGFGLSLETEKSGNIQCIVALAAKIPKGKSLSLAIPSQSIFTGVASIASGQSVGLDANLLVLTDTAVEASKEFQLTAPGPMSSDTDFVRYPMLIRKIDSPCNKTESEITRTVALHFVLYLDRGTVAGKASVMSKELPEISYNITSCQ